MTGEARKKRKGKKKKKTKGRRNKTMYEPQYLLALHRREPEMSTEEPF
jgi:hypothetical protein